MATWELDPTENPDNRPLSTAAYVIRLNTSITITNKSGDKGSPCRRPRELRNFIKKSVRAPLSTQRSNQTSPKRKRLNKPARP
jgi:hypothetical protein